MRIWRNDETTASSCGRLRCLRHGLVRGTKGDYPTECVRSLRRHWSLGLALVRRRLDVHGFYLRRWTLPTLYAMPAYTAALIAVRAWRWNILLAAQGIPLRQWRAYSAYASGIFIGTFTPGRWAIYRRRFMCETSGIYPGKAPYRVQYRPAF